MDRRTLLKSAAALSATAAIPVTAPTVAAADVAAPAVVTPLQARPYTNYVWEWFVSHDGATYYEGFPTKEEAIKYAQQCEYSIVAECKQQDFDLSIPGWVILERLNEDNYELIGEGEGIECTAEQERDLEAMVQRAIEAWVVKHSIHITAWTFDGTQNKTEVPEPSSALPSHQSNTGDSQ